MEKQKQNFEGQKDIMASVQTNKHKTILTNRERELFELLVQNKNTKEIAEFLFISEKTVRGHISRVMKKLNVKGRSQAIIELVRLGEISIK